jgi:hypothetical protein
MSSATAGEPINEQHAELIEQMVAGGYPRTAAWFATQSQAQAFQQTQQTRQQVPHDAHQALIRVEQAQRKREWGQ